MAIIVQNRFPIDSIDRKAIGVNIPFNAPAVFKSNYLTRDAVKNNLINFFSTNPGERVFNPFFGSGLQKYVFENISSVTNDFIKKFITDEINQYFPFVQVAQLGCYFFSSPYSVISGATVLTVISHIRIRSILYASRSCVPGVAKL
jgi:phage baseplate assembly protein W